MSYSVEFAPAAVRGLERVPPRIAAAIMEFATVTLPSNPYRLSKPLKNELEGFRSARRGDYRVLIRIDDQHLSVLVVRIAHRAQAYSSD